MNSIENVLELKSSVDSYYIDLKNVEAFKKFSSLELTITLYPFNNKINSDSFNFLPYEEYVKDLSEKRNTIYFSISSYADVFFGKIAGVTVLLLFLFSNS